MEKACELWCGACKLKGSHGRILVLCLVGLLISAALTVDAVDVVDGLSDGLSAGLLDDDDDDDDHHHHDHDVRAAKANKSNSSQSKKPQKAGKNKINKNSKKKQETEFFSKIRSIWPKHSPPWKYFMNHQAEPEFPWYKMDSLRFTTFWGVSRHALIYPSIHFPSRKSPVSPSRGQRDRGPNPPKMVVWIRCFLLLQSWVFSGSSRSFEFFFFLQVFS